MSTVRRLRNAAYEELTVLYRSEHFLFISTHLRKHQEKGTIITPIMQRRKLRLREMR